MVKIPTFENKTTSAKISNRVIKAPSIAKASQLVGQSVEQLGNTLTKVAVQDAKAKNQFELQKAKTQTQFDIANYKQEKALELQEFKADENYKTTVYEIEQDNKNKFDIAALRIKQKNEVLTAANDLQEFSSNTLANLATSSDLEDQNNFIELLNDKKNSYTFSDNATQILFDNEFVKILENDKYKLKGQIRKNIIDIGISDYNSEVDQNIFKAVYGNMHEQKIGLENLFSADGIVATAHDSQLFLDKDSEYARLRELYGLSLYEKMVDEDPQGFLTLLENQPDVVNSLITTDQIVNFEKIANNKVTVALNGEIADTKAIASNLEAIYKDNKTLLTDITRANLPELNAALETAKNLKMPGTDELYDPQLVSNIEALISLVDIVDEFKTYNHTQGRQIISTLEEEYNNRIENKESLSDFDRLRLNIFKSINNDMTNNIKDDALSVASKYGFIDNIERVNFGADLSDETQKNEFFAQVDANIKQGLKVQEHYNLAHPQFLTKETVAVLSDALTNADGANDIIQIADLIVNSYDEHSLDVFRQLSKEAPLLAEIGGQMQLGNENFAVHLAKGYMLDNEQIIPGFETNKDFRRIVFEELGDSLNDNPQTFKAKIAAINFAVASIGLDEGWYGMNKDASNIVRDNEDRISQIIQQSVGATYADGERVSGGTVKWNGKTIILPVNFNSKDLDDASFENIILDKIANSPNGDDILIEAGKNGAAQFYPGEEIVFGLPTATPFVEVDQRQETGLTAVEVFGGTEPKDEDSFFGSFAMSSRYPAYFWDQVGPGLYMLSLFDPVENGKEPEYLMYPNSNKPFIFDLESVVQFIQ
tara:strand:- start:4859 stop:7330 length:2472 start_codon:yes stop_codon:yes gene_type:complete